MMKVQIFDCGVYSDMRTVGQPGILAPPTQSALRDTAQTSDIVGSHAGSSVTCHSQVKSCLPVLTFRTQQSSPAVRPSSPLMKITCTTLVYCIPAAYWHTGPWIHLLHETHRPVTLFRLQAILVFQRCTIIQIVVDTFKSILHAHS